MTRRHTTTLAFEYETARRAAVVGQAVAREAGDIEGERASATVEIDGRRVTVTVGAEDLTALRAGQTTWCSLVEAAERAAAASE